MKYWRRNSSRAPHAKAKRVLTELMEEHGEKLRELGVVNLSLARIKDHEHLHHTLRGFREQGGMVWSAHWRCEGEVDTEIFHTQGEYVEWERTKGAGAKKSDAVYWNPSVHVRVWVKEK